MTILNCNTKIEYKENYCSVFCGDNRVSLNIKNGNFINRFMENHVFEIRLNDSVIGHVMTFPSFECMYLEYIHLKDDYRRRGYGTMVLELLKDVSRAFNIKCINGECEAELKFFYRALGASFEDRYLEDGTHINSKFHIDL